MGILSWWTARQRLRRAARQSRLAPAFSPSIDCTPWVLGGLWPAELTHVNPQNATLAEYLNADLQRIAIGANQRLQLLRRANLAASARHAEEQHVIRLAREAASLRVESTVRQIRNRPMDQRLQALETADRTTSVLRSATSSRTEDLTTKPLTEGSTEELVTKPVPEKPTEELATGALTGTTAEQFDTGRTRELPTEALVAEPTDALDAADRTDMLDREDGTAELTAQTDSIPAAVEPESDEERLRRLLVSVARQQPELRWAVGDTVDGTTLLVTDLAHGWIPPAITVPAGVRLLEPGRRGGDLMALLGPTTRTDSYVPGDRLGRRAIEVEADSAAPARELPAVADLGWLLSAATHWRDGLPRLAHTLAKAGAAGTGVADSEMNLLRVHLETACYQLLAQYPDIDTAVLMNCLLLAAAEGIASGDLLSANYHFAWFQALNTPPGPTWAAGTN